MVQEAMSRTNKWLITATRDMGEVHIFPADDPIHIEVGPPPEWRIPCSVLTTHIQSAWDAIAEVQGTLQGLLAIGNYKRVSNS